jgi:hypothetical protein
MAADVVSTTGETSRFVAVSVVEADSSFPLINVAFTATLTSPPGMNYDLYVYQPGCTMAYGQSTNGAGTTDTLASGWGDTLGPDDTRTVIFEIRYVSGSACGPDAAWTLTVAGNR